MLVNETIGLMASMIGYTIDFHFNLVYIKFIYVYIYKIMAE